MLTLTFLKVATLELIMLAPMHLADSKKASLDPKHAIYFVPNGLANLNCLLQCSQFYLHHTLEYC